jgi:hypothetical protein
MVGMALLIQHAHMQQRTAVVLHTQHEQIVHDNRTARNKDVPAGLNGWHGSAC